MTSITRSSKTKKKDLTALAFQLMHSMIIEFEEYKTEEGKRTYDSQFSIAVRFGFQSDLIVPRRHFSHKSIIACSIKDFFNI